MKKTEKIALLSGMMLGGIMGVLLYDSRFLSLFFWTIAVVLAFIGYKFGSKGSRGKSLTYFCYGVAFLTTLIYGFLMV